jgi:Na+-transporting NADH:ubiquinone oxidoreductase subunit NqrC
MIISVILTVTLVGSILLNAHQYRALRQKPQRQETYDVKELLADLLSGDGLVQVRRISPTDVFLRSPRDVRR